ncbi:AAA family ATPase [Alkalibacter rhizosphaerae]|uniref:AAA family ATPase n=1 Tax=Alkalibacter rhizosphaerae TaxID=2815577 RepID=A0A974XJJ6_9FIRM|nr:polysaccharide biosynthesis tyrosine autokinase [Alkalibacter rhizosphaerae]QSX09588.1 AAA family ATPase [Alkalibacter rhizosphaerae]
MNIRRIIGMILLKWWLIAAFTLAGAILGWIMIQSAPPVYDAVVTLYSMDLNKLQEEGAQLEYYDIELSREVIDQFSDVIYSRRVTSVVQEELTEYQLTEEEILDMVMIESSIDANIFYIRAKSSDPQLSAKVANASAAQFAATIHELLNTDNVGILDQAEVPGKPEPKGTIAMVLLGGVAGFVVGFSILYLAEYFDPKVYTREDVMEIYEGKSMGAIPKYDASKDWRIFGKPVGNAFEMMVANLKAVRGKSRFGKMVMVTSCNPGEGKTTIAHGLALYSGKTGAKTLLLDSGWKTPKTTPREEETDHPGLMECLRREVGLAEITVQMEENLFFIPLGKEMEDRIKLLMSKQMEDLMVQLAKEYDLVLIDCPSFFEYPDTRILSKKASGFLLVVAKGMTTFKQIDRTISRMETFHCPLMGIVVNKNRREYFG